LGWPGSDWVDTSEPLPTGTPPIDAQWSHVAGDVRHTFTHFHLVLTIMQANVPVDTTGTFIAPTDFRPSDLPTVMRKVFDLATK
jgi:A/G-specific adenine glycosylase